MSEILLNGSQVAERLSISNAFAYKLMRLGRLRSIRIGRSLRVRPSDLEDFILKNEITEEKTNFDHDILTFAGKNKSSGQG